MVNLAATDPVYDKYAHPPKCRPCSAPQTKSETHTLLLSAGKTDDIIRSRELNKMRPGTCKPRILDQIKQERENERRLEDTGTGDGVDNIRLGAMDSKHP